MGAYGETTDTIRNTRQNKKRLSESYVCYLNTVNPYSSLNRYLIVFFVWCKMPSTSLSSLSSFPSLDSSYTLPTAPSVTFPNRLLNAAGCWCTTDHELDELMASASGGVVTKSCTALPRDGNPLPRLYMQSIPPTSSDPAHRMSINSTGLANQGLAAYALYGQMHPPAARPKPYIVSVAGVAYGENVKMVHTLQTDSHTDIDAIELNLSCPNIAGKPQVGYDFEATREVLRQVLAARADACDQYSSTSKTDSATVRRIPIGLKLPPYLDQSHFKSIAEVLDDVLSELAFVTCINSLGNGFVYQQHEPSETEPCFTPAIAPNDGFGGIGGALVKPFGLANVRALHRELPSLPLIGCGGVCTAQDVKEYLAVGASLVQVGTALMHEGPGVFGRLIGENHTE